MAGKDLLVDRSPAFAGLVFHLIDGLLESRYNRSRRVRTEREIILVCREGVDGNIGINRPFFEHQNERPGIATGYDEQDKNGKINRSSPAICAGFLHHITLCDALNQPAEEVLFYSFFGIVPNVSDLFLPDQSGGAG